MRVGTGGVAAMALAAALACRGEARAQASPPSAAKSGAPSSDAPVVTAPDAAPDTAEVVVFGRGEAKIGVAHAASEGTVSGSDLSVRPLLRVAELLEAVPGMIAAQHSGSGKANQYFLRGFNLDHGSDFTTYIDGVQMNFRTHGHGQGYLDLNGLIPEIVAREDFRKGPYRADGGDFALAGAAYMTTIKGFDRPWVSAEVGSYDYGRVAAGGTAHGVLGGDLTLVGQLKAYDGPWQQPEELRHASGFAKWEGQTGLGLLELSAQGYHGQWKPTEQIPERIIGTPICPDVFCSPDPSATGRTDRVILNAKLSGEGWKGAFNVQHYDWNMYSNPTYANPDGTSAQIHQFDRRWVLGFTAERTWELAPNLALRVGTEERYDDIGKVGVQHTIDRTFVSSFGLYSVTEASGSLWGEATWTPIERLRLIGGLRGDYYRATVDAIDAEAAALGTGDRDDAIVSPKFSAAYKLRDDVELYANYGRGFHSNDVRGAVTSTPVPILVPGTGYEVGGRFQRGPFSFTATYWWLDVDSELRFVGDTNAVEPTGASARRGYELVAFWRPLPWLAVDGSYVGSHARYDNGDHIPNAFESAGSFGVSAVGSRWEGSLRVRHLGPSPLIEDDSVRDQGSTVVNIRGAYKMKHVQLYAEVLNILDSRDKDIAYYYESYIPKFDPAPTDGRLSRVVEPRTLRVGAKYTF